MSKEVQESISALYTRLANKTFQEPETGNLTIPYYLYCYDAEKEYEVTEEITRLTNRLNRPDNYLDIPVVNIFQTFLAFLKKNIVGPESLYESILRLEKTAQDEARAILTEQAASEAFFAAVEKQIADYLAAPNPSSEPRAYVFITGWGQIFPYLRSSRFLNYFEKFNRSRYKLIIFYPGKVERFCKLFNLLEDQHPYRVIVL
ncbi:MAG: BREX protein BrxB domain-containing protein [Chitinophagaceae bacterium]